MSAADRERIEYIKSLAESGDCDVNQANVLFLLSQLSALSEALSAAHEEIAQLKATTT